MIIAKLLAYFSRQQGSFVYFNCMYEQHVSYPSPCIHTHIELFKLYISITALPKSKEKWKVCGQVAQYFNIFSHLATAASYGSST